LVSYRDQGLEIEERTLYGIGEDTKLGETSVNNELGEEITKLFTYIEVPKVVGREGLGILEGYHNTHD